VSTGELLRRLRDWWRGHRGASGPGWLGVLGGERHQRGWRAEDYAVARLTREGYHILARNVHVGPGEIDIVAEDGGALAFVEVRSREEDSPMRPVQTLTRDKRERMVRCGEAYVRGRHLRDVRHRFDVVEVYLDDEGRPVWAEVLKDAVTAARKR